MIKPKGNASQPLPKLATGIAGFDNLSRGGLPRHRTSLLIGGPGAGKTVFALQCIANAARRQRTRGIFVAFEENPRQVIANGATFEWGLPKLAEKDLFFLDAHLSPALTKAGDFDLTGLLAMLAAKKKQMNAEWLVLDGIDVLLTLLQDPIAERREIYRIRDWLVENSMTAIITAKLDDHTSEAMQYGFLQFMVDCVVRFERRQQDRVSMHSIQITKYRGSGYEKAEFPVSFGTRGIEVGGLEPAETGLEVSSDRLTTGFERLDTMLDGGVFRGSSTLITGVPGTSKTTLAAQFAEAACLRGEPTLFVSYDESPEQIMRNLSSVGIRLKVHVTSGLLRIHSARTESIGAEEHLIKLRLLIDECQPRCMVIDPLTAIAKAGTLGVAQTVAGRLIYLIKDKGITLLVTALSETDDPRAEATDLQISTIADTWIHLSYLMQSGERNRALTVIKSRGTWHSNQVRELVLSQSGVTLSDVYSAGGEVLMGTLRWEKEAEESAKKHRRSAEIDHRQRELQLAEATTGAQIKALQMQLQRQSAELAAYSDESEVRNLTSSERENELKRMRSADTAGGTSKIKGNGAARHGRGT
jgi:circadian clock protein KaiC